MDRLKNMKETLISCVQSQIGGHLDEVDARELGEAVDMIKDLTEAMYYCSIIEAMEEKEEHDEKHKEVIYYPIYERDMDRSEGRMYYNGYRGRGYPLGPDAYYGNNSNMPYGDRSSMPGSERGNGGYVNTTNGNREHSADMYPREMTRDSREGKSPMSRKSYMEAKEMHHGKEMQMKELEKYLQELSRDVTEMIEGASPEEKQLLKQKMSTLASKIQ